MTTALFTDDFERADGPLGNNWANIANVTIVGGKATPGSGSAAAAYQDIFNGHPDQRVQVLLTPPAVASATKTYSIILRAQASTYTNCYYIQLAFSDPPEVDIIYYSAGAAQHLARQTDFSLPAAPFYFSAEVIGNVIQAFVNGGLVARATNNGFASGRWGGFRQLGDATIVNDEYVAWDITAESILVTPQEVIAGTADNTLTLTGLGTAWTPGTPGSPTFSASEGTITAQTVISATHAELTWTSPDRLCDVLISGDDPNLGAWVAVQTKRQVSGFQIYEKLVESGSGGLSAALIAQMEDYFAAFAGMEIEGVSPNWQALLDFLALWAPENVLSLDAINDLADQLTDVLNELQNTSATPDTHRERLESALAAATAALAEAYFIDGNTTVTLANVRDDIRGLGAPTIYDLQLLINAMTVSGAWDLGDLRTATRFISVDGTVDLNDVISTIEGVRGKTISDLADQLDTIQSAHGYTLETIKDAIDAIVAGSNADVLAELATIRSAHNYTLESIMDAIAAISVTDLSTVYAKLNYISSTDTHNIAEVLTAIGNIAPTDLTSVLTAISTHDTDVKALIGTPQDSLAYIITRMWTDPDYSLPVLHDDITRIMGNPERNLGDIFNTVEEMQATLEEVKALLEVPTFYVQADPGPVFRSAIAYIPLERNMTWTGALNGAYLEVSTLQKAIPQLTIGGFKTFRALGRFAFVTEDGFMEPWRGIPSDKCILMPSSMMNASGIILAFYTDVTGVLTPWSIVVP